jgi:hypothetical protein
MSRGGTHKSSRSCEIAADRPEKPNGNRNMNYPLRFHEILPACSNPLSKGRTGREAAVVPDRRASIIMVNFWQKVNHHEVVYDRNYDRIDDDWLLSSFSWAGSNGGCLEPGRVSHLSMDDQSIRSDGKPLRPIERLAGAGHY